MITVKVPATTANFGSGFDCVGMALKMYNIIYVEEIKHGLQIKVFNKSDKYIPTDENNLVYKAMKETFDLIGYIPSGLRIGLLNDIPMTRGLGSSAACIVGGIAAANALSGNKLSQEEMILLAAQMEGHPDNSTPAFTGGAVIAVIEKGRVNHMKFTIPEKMMFAVITPDFILRTSKARKILPEEVPFKDAVFNVSRAALLGASLALGNFEKLVLATEDRIHQPYRQKLIPSMYEIIDMCTKSGARGTFLSGAGPALIAMVDENYNLFEEIINKFLAGLQNKWEIQLLECDNEGVKVTQK